MEVNFQLYPPGQGRGRWRTVGPSSRKGGRHCVDSSSTLGRLLFGRGTQLTVRPGEWVVFTPEKHFCNGNDEED